MRRVRGVIECVIEDTVPLRKRARFLRREAEVVAFDSRLELAEGVQHLPQCAEMIRRSGGRDDQPRMHSAPGL